MSAKITEAIRFLRENDVKTILSRIRAREVPMLIQFFIYGLCGGLATVVFLSITIGLSYTIIPAMDGMIVDGHLITAELRARNFLINNFIAFLFANVVAYVTNILFVFKSGRHDPKKEFLFFTAINAVSFAISQLAGPLLIQQYNVPTKLALVTNTLASVMLNYVCRKFFVFKK